MKQINSHQRETGVTQRSTLPAASGVAVIIAAMLLCGRAVSAQTPSAESPGDVHTSAARPNTFFNMDLVHAALSPKPLGPLTRFAPPAVRSNSGRDANGPEKSPTKSTANARATRISELARKRQAVRLAKRNPLNAQAFDTRVQRWPCASGGICGWQNPPYSLQPAYPYR